MGVLSDSYFNLATKLGLKQLFKAPLSSVKVDSFQLFAALRNNEAHIKPPFVGI